MKADMSHIIKCCSDFYQTDLVKLLFGDSIHPGGLELTKELAERMILLRGSNVLDVACGIGTSAIFIAKTFGCHVTGIDLGQKNIEEAIKVSSAQNTSKLTDFRIADAEKFDFIDEIFDSILCECSFCLFPDKKKSSDEMFRVVKRNGKIGISDIVLKGELPQKLRSALNEFVCVLEAKTEIEYREYLEDAGFRQFQIYDKKYSILSLLDNIKKRLFAAELLVGLGKVKINNIDLDRIKKMLKELQECVNSGILSYALIIGEKPR